jgi:hypothetical protein
MELKDIIVIIISGLGLIVSVIALIRDFYTRKKVQELTNLQIEKINNEKENMMKAKVYGRIDDDFFVIENYGEAPALNIRYEGWDDWCDNISKNIIQTLPPHHSQSIQLYLTMDSPNSKEFKITWDDEFGKDHVWSDTLDL